MTQNNHFCPTISAYMGGRSLSEGLCTVLNFETPLYSINSSFHW